jgi:hypothetical protein
MIKEQISHLTFLFKFIFYLRVIYYECARKYAGIYMFLSNKAKQIALQMNWRMNYFFTLFISQKWIHYVK